MKNGYSTKGRLKHGVFPFAQGAVLSSEAAPEVFQMPRVQAQPGHSSGWTSITLTAGSSSESPHFILHQDSTGLNRPLSIFPWGRNGGLIKQMQGNSNPGLDRSRSGAFLVRECNAWCLSGRIGNLLKKKLFPISGSGGLNTSTGASVKGLGVRLIPLPEASWPTDGLRKGQESIIQVQFSYPPVVRGEEPDVI